MDKKGSIKGNGSIMDDKKRRSVIPLFDDIKEYFNSIIAVLIILFFLMIDFILVPVALKQLFPETLKGDVDILAFMGNIFGAGATIIAVLLTLRHGEKQRFFEGYYKRKFILQETRSVFLKCIGGSGFFDTETQYRFYESEKKDIEAVVENLKEYAGDAYNSIEIFLKFYFSLDKKRVIDGVGKAVEDRMNYLQNMVTIIGKYIEKLENQKNKYDRQKLF